MLTLTCVHCSLGLECSSSLPLWTILTSEDPADLQPFPCQAFPGPSLPIFGFVPHVAHYRSTLVLQCNYPLSLCPCQGPPFTSGIESRDHMEFTSASPGTGCCPACRGGSGNTLWLDGRAISHEFKYFALNLVSGFLEYLSISARSFECPVWVAFSN